ncbi:peptidoglycan-binding protein [Citrobacter freundii]|nr:peptidoglycan-binding protein [Citrobacter freundii]
MRRVKLLCSLIMLLASQGAQAVSYPLPPEGSRLVGSPLTVTVPPGNTKPLEAFAAQYGQGLSNMLEANPGVDVFLPKSGSTLVCAAATDITGYRTRGDCHQRRRDAALLLSCWQQYG